MITITVDGRDVAVRADRTLLHALQDIGIELPALCDDARLEPYGECRLCLVRIAGEHQPMAACATRATAGMIVETAPDDIESARRGILRMLARHYPTDTVASEPDLLFHRLLDRYGVDATGAASPDLRDNTHPCIAIDMGRCVDCYRCVRICDEVQGVRAWQLAGRGPDTHVVPSGAPTLIESACVSCGACVDTCPSGALQDRPVAELGAPSQWTRTTCPYCGVGCELLIGTRDGRVITATPAHDAPVNRGHACVKGRYAHGFVHSPDRVLGPMVRDGSGWRTTTWEEALAAAARGLQAALERGAPRAVGVFGSARATNEDNYLLQKFARVVLRTNNVDCCARVCHAPSAAGLRQTFGTGAATNSFDDIERARTILVCGSNTTENHPVVGARIRQTARHGAILIVIDPRRIDLVDDAQLHLRPIPGTNVLLLNALAATIVEEELFDHGFLEARVDRLDEYVSFISRYRPEVVAQACGVDARDIRHAARIYASNKPSMIFHGLGITEHSQGTASVMCLANLALLTGNVGRDGSGVNPLRGQNNVQGAAHMGCEPDYLTGFVPVSDDARFADVWHASIPSEPGRDAIEMLDAARNGDLHALWVVGWDILQTQPNMAATERALGALDALVVQDLFLNETARRHGTVFLPACSTFEKDGTFMNGERRVQRVRKVIEPLGRSRPDWEIVCALAAAMGEPQHFAYREPREIWDEIRRVWPVGAGMSYERLEQPGGLQWPCPDESHDGTRVLHRDRFAHDVRTRLQEIEYRPSPEQSDADHQLILITGRGLDQFNAGTMTRRSLVHSLHPTDRLDISPDDAERLGIREGEEVDVTSRYGSATLPAHISAHVAVGQLFATFSDPERRVNQLTSPHADPTTHTPEYKRTLVQLARHN